MASIVWFGIIVAEPLGFGIPDRKLFIVPYYRAEALSSEILATQLFLTLDYRAER